MHARHRSPGNGYRSSSMGMETSGRGYGFYNSEYRSFKRGFGRGQSHSKSFQPHHPPAPRKGTDIFMEAGRLAAEYLVSQGLLPHTVLPAKWQNGGLKKQMGDFQDYRSQEGDSLHLPPDNRTSALARLGNATSDLGLGRRRYLDECNSTGSRNIYKGRRKEGSYRSSSSEWGREYGRSGSWSDRTRASPDFEIDEDNVSGHQDELRVGKDADNGPQKPISSEFAPKSEEEFDNSEVDDKQYLQDELGSKASSSSSGRDQKLETDGKLLKGSDDSKNFSTEVGELKDSSNNIETEEEGTLKDLSCPPSTEDDPLGKTSEDLLAFCKFAKIPTKTRSSLTMKNLKADSVSIGTSNGSQGLLEDNSLGVGGSSSGDTLLNKSQDSKCNPDSELSKNLPAHSFGDVGDLDHIYDVEHGKCSRSQSFPDRALLHDIETELVQEMPSLQRSSSMAVVEERGEKRGLEWSDLRKDAKRQREWLQPVTTQVDLFSDFGDKKGVSVEGTASPAKMVGASSDKDFQDSLVTNGQFPDGDGESSVNYAQEKKLFPNAFKICDLNLMEGSDISENHRNDQIIMYSDASETKNGAATIDIDLSMSSNNSGGGNGHTSNCKEIEVIDLENDSTQEDKADDNMERKSEAMFVSGNGDMTDVPDQYDGLMMTEFFRSFSSCPSEPLQNEDINPLQTEDINPLQNDMGLHNGEGTLGDDDSIYMSLGEIPLSFLQAWEQPPAQGYEKPF